jgi:nucleotide-binding universal stress UspA family protein
VAAAERPPASTRAEEQISVTTVMLAIDETPTSIHAAHEARRLFGPEATYLAVNVAERSAPWTEAQAGWGSVYGLPSAVPPPAMPLDTPMQTADRAALDAAHTAERASIAAGVEADAIGEYGDPVLALLHAADEHQPDVIVVGESDKSWWRRLLETTVWKEIARGAHRPVLVVPSVDEPTDA